MEIKRAGGTDAMPIYEVSDVSAATYSLDRMLLADVRIKVDIAAVARRLGEKAALSKGKRSGIHGAMIVVEAFNIRSKR